MLGSAKPKTTDQHLCQRGQFPANWKWCSSKWQIGSENAHPDSSVSEEINDSDAAPTYNDNILCRHIWVKAKSCLEAGGWPWSQVEEFERLTSLVQVKNEWRAKFLASAGSYKNSLILKQEGLGTGRKVTLSQPSYGVNNRWERGSRPVHWKRSRNVPVFLLSVLPRMHTHLTCVCARTLSAHQQAQTNHSSHFNGKAILSLRGSLLCARLDILHTRRIHKSSQPGSASSLQRAGPPSLHQLLDDEKNENKFLPN